MNTTRAETFYLQALAWLPLLGLYGGRAPLPAVLIFGAVAMWQSRKLLPEKYSGTVWLLLMFWPLLSCLWSYNTLLSYQSWLRVAALMLLGCYMLDWISNKASPAGNKSRWLLYGIAAAAVMLVLESWPAIAPATRFLSWYHNSQLQPAYFNRGLALLALLVWPVSISLYNSGRAKAALWLPVLLLPVFTQFHSLGAGLGLLAGVMVFHIARVFPGLIKIAMRYLLPMAVITLPLWMPYFLDILWHKNDSLPESSRQRLVIWQFALGKALEHPLLGWGFDTSRIMPGGHDIQSGAVLLPLHPHNALLQIFLELGWVGLGCFCACWMMVTAKISALADGVRPFVWAAVSGWLLIAATDYGIWQYWWLAAGWWLAAALSYSFKEP